MPVLLLTAPPLEPQAEVSALTALAAAVASALGLPVDGVVVTLSHAVRTIVGTDAGGCWPIVVLHGRGRPEAAMSAALRASREVCAAHWSCPVDEVWAEWSVTVVEESR